MRRNLFFKNLVILCLAGFLMTAPQIFAENDSSLNDEAENENKDLSETAIIDNIVDKMAQEGGDPKYGPQTFRVITLKATGKKIYVPLWYNDKVTKPEENPDPFRPAIKKESPANNPSSQRPIVVTPPPKPQPPKKEIPPLKIYVKGIVGNEGIRYAVIDFEKEERTIVKDQVVDGKFKVIDIYSDRIVVYSNAEQRRYTFKIGGEEKEKEK